MKTKKTTPKKKVLELRTALDIFLEVLERGTKATGYEIHIQSCDINLEKKKITITGV